MIINGSRLLQLTPIRNMLAEKRTEHGVSYGLGEAGYDIRIKQSIQFSPGDPFNPARVAVMLPGHEPDFETGRFALASTIEEFQMPETLVGVVHDKSTWARRGLSVFNTVIEPGWKGYLTLELVYHGNKELIIPAGAGIAQVLFHETQEAAAYNGKYQHQDDRPVPARAS